MYKLFFSDKSIDSATLISQLERIETSESERIKANIQEIEKHGCKYTNQDFDVLSRAFHFLEKSNLPERVYHAQ